MIDTYEKQSNQRSAILAVDAEAFNREMLASAFEDRCDLTQVACGPAVFTALREQHFDLVLLDLTASQSDGLKLLAALRADASLAQIPVIAVTDRADSVSQVRALDAGAQDVIRKPCSTEIVRHRVYSVLDRYQAYQKNGEAHTSANLTQMEIDERTGLYTKQAFCRKTAELMQAHRDRQYVICRWDIDHFKVYNDLFGVKAGDELLEKIGATAKKAMGNNSMVVGHLEADHFAACVENGLYTDEQIYRHIASFTDGINEQFSFVTRLGAYLVTDPSLEVSLMCDRAGLALSSTKYSYSVRMAWYDESMRRGLIEEQMLVEGLDGALKGGQFLVYLQPQFNYENGVMVGAEALVRWQHPTKGLVSPETFIPLFERNGFIRRMDEYVWEQVCVLLRGWMDAGLPTVPIAINISRFDIYGSHPTDILLSLLARYGLDTSMLRLEVTESAFMHDPKKLVSTIDELKSKGFRVEMDDFGSGFSSLNTLKEVHVDTLKMDMKFLETGKDDDRAGLILSSVVRMASWLNLPVLAEGVETREQADYLKSLGCYYMQGYYFAKPMPAAEFEERLRNGKTDAVIPDISENRVRGSIDFLNASTQATLMFNSFVGGAQIIELHGDNIEMLRANDRFFTVTGIPRESYSEMQKHLQDRFYPQSRLDILAMLHRAVETGDPQECELHALPAYPGGAELWTLVRARHLISNGDRDIFYLSVDNISERKERDAIQSRLDTILHSIPAGIGVFELRKNTIYPLFVSDRTIEIFGFTREEYDDRIERGEPVFTKFSKSDSAALQPGSQIEELTMLAKRRDESRFWLRIVYTVTGREDGTLLLNAALMDVTAQHTADSENAILIDSIPGGVLKYSASDHNTLSYISDNMLSMLECTRETFAEAYGNSLISIICAEDRERIIREVREKVSQPGQRGTVEFRIVTKSGRLRHVHAAGYMTEDIDGKCWYYVIVTDRENSKRLEVELAEKSAQAEAMIKNAPGGVVSFCVQNGKLVREYASEGVARLYGCEPQALERLFAEGLFMRVHPDDREALKRSAGEIIRKRTPFSEQFRARRADGSYIYVNLTGNPAVGPDGVLRFYCTYTDVTEQVEAADRLRLEKQKTDYAISGTGLLVWEYNLVNQTYTRLGAGTDRSLPPVFEGGPEAFAKTGWIAPQSLQNFYELHRALSEGAPTVVRDLATVTENGACRWRRISYRTVFADGTPVSAIGIGTDITAEAEANAKSRELEMAINASSLYFWTYDIRNGQFPVVNHNAAVLGIGKTIDGKRMGLRESGCLAPDGQRQASALFHHLIDNPKNGEDGTQVLHMDRTVSGMDWMRVYYAVIRDTSGEAVALSFIGEDYSDSYESERMYEDALAGVEHIDDSGTYASMLVNLSDDLVEKSRYESCRRGMRFEASTAKLTHRIYTDAQRKRAEGVLARDALLSAFHAGRATVSVEYQYFADDAHMPRWICTTVRTFRDTKSGKIKSLFYSVDIDREVTDREVAAVLTHGNYELLAMLYTDSGWMRCYKQSPLEQDAGLNAECLYDEGISIFLSRYMQPSEQERARGELGLTGIIRVLAEKQVGDVIFPLTINGEVLYKRWNFRWLNDEKRVIIISRSDITDVIMLRQRNEEMQLALRHSNTVICHYDVQTRTLTMPQDYADLFGLQPVAHDIPSEAHDVAMYDRANYEAFYRRIIDGEPSGEAVIQFTTVNGDPRWEHVSFVTRFDAQGKAVSAVISNIDITTQRLHEIEAERNRLLLERIGIALFDYDVKSDTLCFEAIRKDQGAVRKTYPNYYKYMATGGTVHPKSVATLRKIIRDSRLKPVSGMVEYQADNWGTGYRWCRMYYASVVGTAGDVFRIVGQISDIQEEKDRETLLDDLRQHMRHEGGDCVAAYDEVVVPAILQYLASTPDTEAAINRMLALLGNQYGLDRVFVFETERDGKHSSCTYEWCADGVKPQIAHHKRLPDSRLGAGFLARFQKDRLLVCNNFAEIPATLTKHLGSYRIGALLLSAITDDGRFEGLIGFECHTERAWTGEQIGTAAIIADVLTMNLRRSHDRKAEESLQISADENAIIIRQSGKRVIRYHIDRDVAENMLDRSTLFGLSYRIERFSEVLVERGIIAPESIPAYRAFIDGMRGGESEGQCNVLINRADGQQSWICMTDSMVYDSNDQPVHAVIMAYDNTEVVEKELAYNRWKSSLDKILTTNTPYLEANITKDVVERYENLDFDKPKTGAPSLTHFIDYAAKLIVVDDDVDAFRSFFDRNRMLALYYSGTKEDAMRYRAVINGVEKWFRVDLQMVKYPYSDDIKGFITYNDIDDEEREREHLAATAQKDAMTDLLNRTTLQNRVEAALAAAEPTDRVALFMLDIDAFKSINDTLGHQQGDHAIVRTGQVLREAFRSEDLIGRVGGDEFMVFIARGATDEVLQRKTEQLLTRMQFRVGSVHASASIGIAVANGCNVQFERLYAVADKALYHAKDNGKNTYCIIDVNNDMHIQTGSSSHVQLPGTVPDVTKHRHTGDSAAPGEREKRQSLCVSALTDFFDAVYEINWRTNTVALRFSKLRHDGENCDDTDCVYTLAETVKQCEIMMTGDQIKTALKDILGKGAAGLPSTSAPLHGTVNRGDGTEADLQAVFMPLDADSCLLCIFGLVPHAETPNADTQTAGESSV